MDTIFILIVLVLAVFGFTSFHAAFSVIGGYFVLMLAISVAFVLLIGAAIGVGTLIRKIRGLSGPSA